MRSTGWFIISVVFSVVFSGCAVKERSNIKAVETFVVEFDHSSAPSRGLLTDLVMQGLVKGGDMLAEKSAQTLASSYSSPISVNNYYNTFNGELEKNYNRIVIKKYAIPEEASKKSELEVIIRDEVTKFELPQTRGATSFFSINDIIREEENDLMNFFAIIEIESAEHNPMASRLVLKDLRVIFSKTKVFQGDFINAILSVVIKGKVLDRDGLPRDITLIEQEYEFKNLQYSTGNQIKNPIKSPWYYDLPIKNTPADADEFGLVDITVQLREYESGKGKYVEKLPDILSENKNAIIQTGSETMNKIIHKKEKE